MKTWMVEIWTVEAPSGKSPWKLWWLPGKSEGKTTSRASERASWPLERMATSTKWTPFYRYGPLRDSFAFYFYYFHAGCFEQINSSLNKSFTWHTNMIGPPRRENNIRQQEPVEWFRIYYLEQAGGSKQSNMGGGRCVKIIDWTIPRRETLFSSMPPSDSLVYVTDP